MSSRPGKILGVFPTALSGPLLGYGGSWLPMRRNSVGKMDKESLRKLWNEILSPLFAKSLIMLGAAIPLQGAKDVLFGFINNLMLFPTETRTPQRRCVRSTCHRAKLNRVASQRASLQLWLMTTKPS